MLKIKDIKWVNGYKIKVLFDGNNEKICDLSDFLEKGDFVELKDISLFKQFRNTGLSIEWPNELDLSSDTLFYIGN
ncbi:MAG: hypothetical protein A2086_13110 [Spirochaetes bacterium GWD1_27_9]|nr:MAG: hypothetical protein A2Z98_07670 [Spirochaetes bacterium GWB1_27_13]OHD26813.1 MAG: hypothetical protein A2Y34_18085 [Spirochaetes bacterium GWC1_27_15]OHD43600.1 MAG: hypothetical protein A2086_13110 [Spirochaetes bacterium GWD1_27_9]